MRPFVRSLGRWVFFGCIALAIAVWIISKLTYDRPFAVQLGHYHNSKLSWVAIELSMGILQVETPKFGLMISSGDAIFLSLLFPAFVLFRRAVMPASQTPGGFPVLPKRSGKKSDAAVPRIPSEENEHPK